MRWIVLLYRTADTYGGRATTFDSTTVRTGKGERVREGDSETKGDEENGEGVKENKRERDLAGHEESARRVHGRGMPFNLLNWSVAQNFP